MAPAVAIVNVYKIIRNLTDNNVCPDQGVERGFLLFEYSHEGYCDMLRKEDICCWWIY